MFNAGMQNRQTRGNHMAGDTVRREWSDFKSFAFKGNAFDLAVGVIVGAAFSRIVDGIVNLLIMPIIGALTGGLNFDDYFLPLNANVTATTLAAAQKQGAVLAYGAFITVVINFLLVAFVLFQFVLVPVTPSVAATAPNSSPTIAYTPNTSPGSAANSPLSANA